MLADLHLRLEEVPLPEAELPVRSRAEAIVHGDLHPDNVIVTERGPVVIDWPNAVLGPKGFDAAHTWLLVATADIEAGAVASALQRWGRRAFLRQFVDRCGRDRLRAHLPEAAAHKLLDANVRPHEADAMRALVRDQS